MHLSIETSLFLHFLGGFWYRDSKYILHVLTIAIYVTVHDVIPGGGKVFCTHPDPASFTLVVRAFPGVKWLGHGIDCPPQSSIKVTETVERFLYATCGPLKTCSRMKF